MGLPISAEQIDAMALGDRGATAAELAALDELGYVVVPGVLGPAQLEPLRAEFERLIAADPEAWTHELGTRRSNAGNDNEVLAVCWRHRVALEAAAHLLGDRFEVGGVDLRDPNPGHGVQKHHPDHGEIPVPGLTVTWFLDPFTETNGATKVVPRSHLAAPPPAAPRAEWTLAGETLALGEAGSLLLRDARLFHAAGRNRTTTRRRGALVFYQHLIP